MSVRAAISLGVVLAVSILVVGASARRAGAAASSRAWAQTRLVALAADAQELVSLRSREETVASGQRPAQDVIAQVTTALAQVGLPSERLKDLAQQSDTALTSPQDSGAKEAAYRQQTVRFTLEPLTTRELGEFLNTWRSSQRVWTVTQVEFTHSGRDDVPAFRAVLQIAAVYLSAPGTNAEPSESPNEERR